MLGAEAEAEDELTKLEWLQILADELLAEEPTTDGQYGGFRLSQLNTAINTLKVVMAKQSASFDRSEQPQVEGFVSTVSWLRHGCNLSGSEAAGAFWVGQHLEKLPASASAMRGGEIGFGHLSQMASTAEALAEAEPAVAFDEAPLLRLAKQHMVNRFRKDCAHVRHAASERAFLQRQLAEDSYRALKMVPLEEGGLYMSGWFDAVGGATVRTALEALARKLGKDDRRSLEERYADAMVELAGHGLDSGTLPSVRGQRPHLQVTATVETLQNMAGAPAGEVEWGGVIAATTVQRLACDSTVSRVLFDSKSQVIDVGRKTRVISSPMRTALRARDDGCVWPGCDRPASWTSAHHVAHWVAHRGETNLTNLESLCGRHHWQVHEGGWQMLRTDEGITVIPPLQDYVQPPDPPPRE